MAIYRFYTKAQNFVCPTERTLEAKRCTIKVFGGRWCGAKKLKIPFQVLFRRYNISFLSPNF